MCGRYHMGEDTLDEAVELLGAVREAETGTGDVFPGQEAPVILMRNSSLRADMLRWGFPARDGKRLLINARAETAYQKPMFSASMLQRRCVMPADSFYEWDQNRQMFTFKMPDASLFFLAGCYNVFGTERRYVVLTREANASMEKVHDRMPLILDAEQAKQWICDAESAQRLVRAQMPLLASDGAFIQTSFLS